MKAYLYLENGQSFEAEYFAKPENDIIFSEIVFNTSMQGYQEVISDPSYCDQSIVMTYPLVGNYGISLDDSESMTPRLKAFIVREYCDHPSNFRKRQNLSEYLEAHDVAGIHKLDTRKLVKVIREFGTMKSLISAKELSDKEKETLFKEDFTQDQIQKVSTKTVSHFPSNGGTRVVMLDFGYKKNILESLIKRGCDVIVVPWDTSAKKIESYTPQGILLSNGPGDPKSIADTLIPTVKTLQEKYPIFSICMGHQIFALANGADTEKMKFGHRGGNHPVKDFTTDRTYITAQNHGYCVKESSINGTSLEVTQINLNDKTIEGLRHKKKPCFSVQYHPEANPGPHDTKYLFDQFLNAMNGEVSHA